ncbi:hypothetical protein LZC95_52485 [Pendulispora brunnea]|uniref:Carboxypeptidase regulatory-like domain-containing protein n=1 Tax=Pendulispora brunnea TaxID=2905690 RepID=A0ABZ2K8L7_9BACT
MKRTLASLQWLLLISATLPLASGCASDGDESASNHDDSVKTGQGEGAGDVVGVLRGGRNGSSMYPSGPVSGATIVSGETVTTTDERGRFVLPKAPAKYDIRFAVNGRGGVYQGLTTRRPTIRAEDKGRFNEAPLHVDYSNATQIGSKRVTFAVRDDIGIEQVDSWVRGDNAFDSTLYWSGADSKLTGKLLSFEYDPPRDGEPPWFYLGVASSPMNASPGEQASFTPVYSPIKTPRVVTAVARPAAGMTVYYAYLLLSLDGRRYAQINTSSPATKFPAEFVVPEVSGASWAIRYYSYETRFPDSAGGAHSGMIVPIDVDGSLPPVDLPAPPKFTLPLDGAADFGPGSEIAWQGGQGACTVRISNLPTGSYIQLTTTESHITMPDLSDVGLPLERGQKYRLFLDCVQLSHRSPDADPVLDDSVQLGTYLYNRNIYVSTPQ